MTQGFKRLLIYRTLRRKRFCKNNTTPSPQKNTLLSPGGMVIGHKQSAHRSHQSHATILLLIVPHALRLPHKICFLPSPAVLLDSFSKLLAWENTTLLVFFPHFCVEDDQHRKPTRNPAYAPVKLSLKIQPQDLFPI